MQQVKLGSSRRQWRAEQGQEVRISIQRGPSTRALGGLLKEPLGDTRAPSGGGDCGENEAGGRWVGGGFEGLGIVGMIGQVSQC